MKSDIIIVGGGLNGCALALSAAQSGFDVVIIDAQTREDKSGAAFDGRSYALAHASKRLLEAIGIWPSLQAEAEPMLDIKVTDGRAGEGSAPWMMHFNHREIEEGPMGYMVEDRHLRRAFLTAIDAEQKITMIEGVRVIAQQVAGSAGNVTLDTGDVWTSALIVGSDGRTSGTGERAGITRTTWSYNQTAIVCAVSHEAPHNGTAHQFFMPPGPLAILPLTKNRSSIVWAETSERAEALMALEDAKFLDALRPAFGSFLGEIALDGARFSYPLGLTLANKLTDERVVLIGDAAHGVHPIAGQGLNAGLRDVAALVEVLALARRRGEDIGTQVVLERYAQWRRFDTMSLAVATDAFNRLFSNDNGLLRLGRDIGMGVVNAIPGLRRSFIREAAGLTGDVPKLMQGKSV